MTDWKQNKNWSDRFLPEIKKIIGAYLVNEAPMIEDMKRNTDLIVLKQDETRIACRVRQFGYIENYGDEFTIRSWLRNGTATELDKIKEGWGDLFFYGFSDEDEVNLAKWTLMDLECFRQWYKQQNNPGIPRRNQDGLTGFHVFRWVDMPAGAIVADSNPDLEFYQVLKVIEDAGGTVDIDYSTHDLIVRVPPDVLTDKMKATCDDIGQKYTIISKL